MTREDVIKNRIDEITKDIETIDRMIMKEAKKLCESVNPKSLEKLNNHRIDRELLIRTQNELYAILGTSLNSR